MKERERWGKEQRTMWRWKMAHDDETTQEM